jgi:hypothetical protein
VTAGNTSTNVEGMPRVGISPILRAILVVHLEVVGFGYLLNGPQAYSADSFTNIRELGVPMWMWFAAYIAAGVLIAIGQHALGHSLAIIVFTFWGVCFLAAWFQGHLDGWGSVAHPNFLALPLHVLGAWRRTSSRVRGDA